jgi:SAM-dependent methyltransferase
MLFLELALIRWTAGNVIHLGYFANLVLLGSFLGVGIGFLRAGRGDQRFPWFSFVILGVLVGALHQWPVVVERSGSDVVFFTSLALSGPPAWLILPAVFIGTAAILIGPGQLVGQCFAELPRLEAYRLDLIGSLIGIVGFSLVSFLRAPSIVWGVVVAVVVLVLYGRRPPLVAVAALSLLVATLMLETLTPGVSWSPYNKIQTAEVGEGQDRVVGISANGVPHQAALSLPTRAEVDPQYTLPYERRANQDGPGRVLIIGGGSGNDVALALAQGATSVTAVEIDPRIQQIGAQRHPDQPYSDPRVDVHIDDGRAFLTRSNEQFDTILFALPDSLTLVSGASQIRLESYLFTQEAMESVRERLAPGGTFSMYNFYREEWLIGRLANTVESAFGHAPCVDVLSDRNRAVITAGYDTADQVCAETVDRPSGPAPVTDARPFLYLRDATIPSIYLWTVLGIVLISLVAVRWAAGSYRRLLPYRDLFLLGAAFLLLETRSVATFALLFGTTWFVNAIVFGGVLLIVLLAVEVTSRWRTPPLKYMYALLAVTLVIAALVPQASLLELPVVPRAIVAIAIAFAPIFTANVIFAKRFATTADGASALGANLLGAMIGGCLEYSALLIGYPALIALAAVLYLGAFLVTPKVSAPGPVAPVAGS